MNLVEILARELKEWPAGAEYITQDYDGECFTQNKHESILSFATNLCENHRKILQPYPCDGGVNIEMVTRAQWGAERARIAGLDAKTKEHDGESITPVLCSAPGYEQELWDKVAASLAPAVYADAMSEFAKDGCPCEDWRDYVASDICNMADAFMAARAKRLEAKK